MFDVTLEEAECALALSGETKPADFGGDTNCSRGKDIGLAAERLVSLGDPSEVMVWLRTLNSFIHCLAIIAWKTFDYPYEMQVEMRKRM